MAEVHTAHEWGFLTPSAFRELPLDERAEMMEYVIERAEMEEVERWIQQKKQPNA